jgi:biotin carboxyl carrier protein
MNPRKRQVRVTVNGREYLVEVYDLNTDPIIATVADQKFIVSVEDVALPEPVVAVEPKPVSGQKSKPVAHQALRAPVSTPADAENVVIAPMPGDLIDIFVQSGDEVSVGQELCSLEAMKMKNVIRSPRAGVIASVPVTRGQAVSYGDVLVTFE